MAVGKADPPNTNLCELDAGEKRKVVFTYKKGRNESCKKSSINQSSTYLKMHKETLTVLSDISNTLRSVDSNINLINNNLNQLNHTMSDLTDLVREVID